MGVKAPEILSRLSQALSVHETCVLLGWGKGSSLVKLKLKRNTLLKGHLTNAAAFQILFPCKLKTSSALKFIRKTIAKYTHEEKKISISKYKMGSVTKCNYLFLLNIT